jgi:hypothetical protein
MRIVIQLGGLPDLPWVGTPVTWYAATKDATDTITTAWPLSSASAGGRVREGDIARGHDELHHRNRLHWVAPTPATLAPSLKKGAAREACPR